MLTRVGLLGQSWASFAPWTNVYGVGRSLLAIGTAATLAASAPETLFRPALGLPPAPYCVGPTNLSFFCLFPQDALWLARWVAVAILLIVASGWRPRLTAVPHWWISWSFFASATIPDGGDQVGAVLTLLLLPVALTDPRRWHWQRHVSYDAMSTREQFARLVALSAFLAVRVQVAGIYFHSSLGKLGVTEWVDGTAIYYWQLDPAFGVPGWLRGPVSAIVATNLGVVAMTWGAIVLEFCLALGLILDRRWRAYLLPLGLLFHAFITVTMGLVSFGIAMSAALVLYLRPVERELVMPARVRALMDRVSAARRARPRARVALWPRPATK